MRLHAYIDRFKVVTRVGLAYMRCVRTDCLAHVARILRILKIIITFGVFAERRIVFYGTLDEGRAYNRFKYLSKQIASSQVRHIPLFQRPNSLAPCSSLPRFRSSPSSTTGLSAKNLWNSGTSCSSWRKTKKLPSVVHSGRSATLSPGFRQRITPGCVS